MSRYPTKIIKSLRVIDAIQSILSRRLLMTTNIYFQTKTKIQSQPSFPRTLQNRIDQLITRRWLSTYNVNTAKYTFPASGHRFYRMRINQPVVEKSLHGREGLTTEDAVVGSCISSKCALESDFVSKNGGGHQPRRLNRQLARLGHRLAERLNSNVPAASPADGAVA